MGAEAPMLFVLTDAVKVRSWKINTEDRVPLLYKYHDYHLHKRESGEDILNVNEFKVNIIGKTIKISQTDLATN